MTVKRNFLICIARRSSVFLTFGKGMISHLIYLVARITLEETGGNLKNVINGSVGGTYKKNEIIQIFERKE